MASGIDILLRIGNPLRGAVYKIIHDVARMVGVIAFWGPGWYRNSHGEGENGCDSSDELFDLHVEYGSWLRVSYNLVRGGDYDSLGRYRVIL